MAQLGFASHGSPVFPLYFNPNVLFQASFNDPTPAIPTENIPIYILASVKNSGSAASIGATVKFWVCNPATVPTPSNSTLVGTSNVSLDAGETKTVLCVSAWVPRWVNNGHECVICEVSAINDPSPAHPSTAWDINDRHVAQHNVDIVFHSMKHSFPALTSMAAVGLYNTASARITVRPAPDELVAPALRKFGLSHSRNVTEESTSGLVSDYIAGAPLPEHPQNCIVLKELPPNHERGFHALVALPEQRQSSAAIFLVEQHDDKGRLVGGVAIMALGDASSVFTPRKPERRKSLALDIPVSIPYRPYCTNVNTGFMTPDGIFMTNLGTQLINVETRNDSGQQLNGLSIYVEGIADPMVNSPIAVRSTAGATLGGASFKTLFSADFSKATPGETVVSFIVQQQSGTSSKSVRVVKKIFVVGIDFDKAAGSFLLRIPQGTMHLHIGTVIAPAKLPCTCQPDPSNRCCCCGGGPRGTGGTGSGTSPYPVLIKEGSMTWVPSPSYAGTHGPLPFNDPWWKILGLIVAAILAIAGSVVAALSGGDASGGPTGSFDETDGTVHCCDGARVSASTNNGTAAALFGAAATVAAVAAYSDESDLFDRGQTQTPPKPGEQTVGETVNFKINHDDAPSPGTNFSGTIEWDYKRDLASGRSLTFGKKDDFSNIHFLKSYKVNIDGTHHDSKLYVHHRGNPLLISAQFTKPDGTLFRGAQLFVFALLWSDTGERIGVELRDDGFGEIGGFETTSTQGKEMLPKRALLAGSSETHEQSVLTERGVRLSSDVPVVADFVQKPNSGIYVSVSRGFMERPVGNWYVYVFAQDVNTVLEGTEPRKAAQTIGGMLLTTQFVFGLNDKPCELNYDAVVNLVGTSASGQT